MISGATGQLQDGRARSGNGWEASWVTRAVYRADRRCRIPAVPARMVAAVLIKTIRKSSIFLRCPFR